MSKRVIVNVFLLKIEGFPGSSASKESACNAGDSALIPRSGRSPVRRAGLPTPVLLPEESSWTQEPDGLQSMGSHRVGHH